MTPPQRTRDRVAELDFRGLHVLVDDDPRWPLDPVVQARASCRGGARVVQLRAKCAGDRQALAWAREIRALTRDCGACFVVNDRFDLALAAGADAVHLGQTDIPPGALPDGVHAEIAIGRSTHTVEEARASRREPVDYVAFGPVFGTHSKESEYGERGLAMLEEVVGIVAPFPLIAIGGIGPAQIADVGRAGAAGVAVISAVAKARDPERATRELVRLLDEARGQREHGP